LLAEALLGTEHDDPGRLGVRLAHLVPPVVLLRARQRHVAPFHLAPRHDDSGGRSRFLLALRCCCGPPLATGAAIAVDGMAAPARLRWRLAIPGPATGALPQVEPGLLLLVVATGPAAWAQHERLLLWVAA
jgi:hypothetical protein